MKKQILALVLSLMTLPAWAQSFPEQLLETQLLQTLRDEFQLEKDYENLRIRESLSASQGDRDLLSVTLHADRNGSFRLLAQGPRGFAKSSRPYPVLFVSAGFFSGSQPAQILSNRNDTVVVAFEYSPDPEGIFRHPDELARGVKQVPARLYMSLRWLQQQSWCDPTRLHVMGVSLGTLFLPVTLRLLQTDGYDFASYISAFGGAGVKHPLFQVLREIFGEQESRLLTEIIGTIVAPYEPSIYLPRLTGKKLVIHGSADKTFTRPSKELLNRALRGPKMTCTVQGEHINMIQPREINLTLAILGPWVGSVSQIGGELPRLELPDTSCLTDL